MFDVGFWELALIGVVGLLVVGPERLPGVARTIGRWVGQAQRMVRSVRSDIERELETENLRNMLNQQEEQIKELKGIVEDVRDDAEATVGGASLSDEFARMQQQFDGERREAPDPPTPRGVDAEGGGPAAPVPGEGAGETAATEPAPAPGTGHREDGAEPAAKQ